MISKNNSQLLESIAAAYILGYKTNTRLTGKPDSIKVFKRMLESSRDLYKTLSTPGVTMQVIKKKLDVKRKRSEEFYQQFGYMWSL